LDSGLGDGGSAFGKAYEVFARLAERDLPEHEASSKADAEQRLLTDDRPSRGGPRPKSGQTASLNRVF
jgi:hypothetical protein